ncbi:MAG: PEP-CTERM sorting domain-containing protein [Candidatus Auribacter fodinae]|jgi:hypothetical protein|uniref:PEP-CTERM sorting domain-containing protein n=1 Tax=Candidatus Auribacter fodinae TaxID=2093366 RepID=A0A3A4R6E8_9BACT|nr:MAG: PEP-CTERM sorting domain-containing protein [Candidatus Auribacter fodinae]
MSVHKALSIVCVGILFSMAVSAGASEVEIDFTYVSGGGLNQTTMITSGSGITGNVTWTATSVPYPAGDRYLMNYLIDDILAQVSGNYWLPAANVTNLFIVFPESVYITKIRTYNYIGPDFGPRWSESDILVSSDGSNYTEEGMVRLDGSPAYTDYVDIAINDYVKSIEYRYYRHDPAGYYAINEIEIYMDAEAVVAVPEPTSIMLLGLGVAGLMRRKIKK